jgi:hypothetical protein
MQATQQYLPRLVSTIDGYEGRGWLRERECEQTDDDAVTTENRRPCRVYTLLGVCKLVACTVRIVQ